MSKKQQFTPWFPADVKPARHGVYECIGDPSFAGRYQYWNGKFWGGWADDVKSALANRVFVSVRNSPKWRGLAVKHD